MKYLLCVLAAFALCATAAAAGAAGNSEGFLLDIPTEWMNLANRIRLAKADPSSDEIDIKWNASNIFYHRLDSFEGKRTFRSRFGALAATYTTRDASPMWRFSSVRLRAEVAYTGYSSREDVMHLHVAHAVVGVYLEPRALRWKSGGIGFALGAAGEQWLAAETVGSLSQSGARAGAQVALEIRQGVASFGDHQVKLVATITRQNYFIAEPHQSKTLLQVGAGIAL